MTEEKIWKNQRFLSVTLALLAMSPSLVNAETLFTRTHAARQIKKKDGMSFYCPAETKSCIAEDQIKQGKAIEKMTASWNGPSPAQEVCAGIGGSSDTLHDQKNNSVAICGFSDRSFLVIWNYIRHFSKK